MSLTSQAPYFNLVQALRYAGVAGVVVLLYDHFLSIEDEIHYIWRAKWSAPKLSFLISRYVVPCAILYHTYQLGGSSVLSNDFCHRWFISAALLCLVATGPLHFLMMLWLWVLWERNRFLIVGTLGLFVLTELSIIGITILAIVHITPMVVFDTEHLLCTLTNRAPFPFLFVPGLLFETIAFIAVCWNSLKRARVRHTDIVAHLHQDGIMFILVIFLTSTANFVSTLLAPLSVVFLDVGFLLCTNTITVTKLILKLRKLTSQKRDVGDPISMSSIPLYPESHSVG